MSLIRRTVLAVFFAMVLAPDLGAQTLPRVLLTTSLGDIELEIDSVRAPITAANFLKYVDAGLYNGGTFHRTVRMDNQQNSAVKIEVIQGGINSARRSEGFPAITLERTNATGISHKDGVISMARSADPNSARSDFFICIGDQPSLDFGGARNADGQGFAAFGRVLRGMDVVRKIQASPSTGQNPQTLTPPIPLTTARRAPR